MVVQHKSGVGRKWEVDKELENTWCTKIVGPTNYYLPKSEFIQVQPDEELEDVTAEYVVEDRSFLIVHSVEKCLPGSPNFRSDIVRKIDGMHNGPAFIVERRKS